MSESESSNSRLQDDRLAEFADRLLAGTAKQADPNAEEELRGLEETLLRLQRAFPATQLEQARIQQMQARLNNRLKQETAGRKNSTQRIPALNWQRTGLVLAGLAALLLLVLLPGLPQGDPSNTTGTAGLNTPIITAAVVLLGVLAIMLWLNRRK